MASTESEARIDAEASAVPSESAPAEGAPADKSAKSQPATAPGGQPPQHRGGGKKKDKKKKKAKQEYLKCPKGTKDYGPAEMVIRGQMLRTIEQSFRKFGARRIETPVFELKETLTGKYGEDSKLIYDLADQGGEICALRYDLTVPFARYVAMNGIKQMKRFQISRVYRRDQPAMNRGRYREFYQCDFDICGVYDSMVADAELCAVVVDSLQALDVGEFKVKINDRKLLDGMLQVCGVPPEQFRPICSAIDKLDKMSWAEVRNEMVTEKHLDPDVADRIKPFVEISGSIEEVKSKVEEMGLLENPLAKQGIEELVQLGVYLRCYGIESLFSFDLSMARGLDYYTGVILEAVLVGSNVGSVAGGGRYDGLVGIFGSTDIPAVGFSLGVERIFTVLMKKNKSKRECETEVLVATIDKNLLQDRMRICSELRSAGIATEMLYKANPRIKPQLSYAEDNDVPVAVVIGGREVENGVVQVKVLQTRTQVTVKREHMIQAVQRALRGEEILCDDIPDASQ